MHELGITQNVLEIALRHADKAGATRINEINLVIGEMANVVDDSVQFYWEMIAKDTIAEGAHLNFRRIPAALHCDDCQQDVAMDRQNFVCPNCGSPKLTITSGQEFYLDSIDIDLPSDNKDS